MSGDRDELAIKIGLCGGGIVAVLAAVVLSSSAVPYDYRFSGGAALWALPFIWFWVGVPLYVLSHVLLALLDKWQRERKS